MAGKTTMIRTAEWTRGRKEATFLHKGVPCRVWQPHRKGWDSLTGEFDLVYWKAKVEIKSRGYLIACETRIRYRTLEDAAGAARKMAEAILAAPGAAERVRKQ